MKKEPPIHLGMQIAQTGKPFLGKKRIPSIISVCNAILRANIKTGDSWKFFISARSGLTLQIPRVFHAGVSPFEIFTLGKNSNGEWVVAIQPGYIYDGTTEFLPPGGCYPTTFALQNSNSTQWDFYLVSLDSVVPEFVALGNNNDANTAYKLSDGTTFDFSSWLLANGASPVYKVLIGRVFTSSNSNEAPDIVQPDPIPDLNSLLETRLSYKGNFSLNIYYYAGDIVKTTIDGEDYIFICLPSDAIISAGGMIGVPPLLGYPEPYPWRLLGKTTDNAP